MKTKIVSHHHNQEPNIKQMRDQVPHSSLLVLVDNACYFLLFSFPFVIINKRETKIIQVN